MPGHLRNSMGMLNVLVVMLKVVISMLLMCLLAWDSSSSLLPIQSQMRSPRCRLLSMRNRRASL